MITFLAFRFSFSLLDLARHFPAFQVSRGFIQNIVRSVLGLSV